MLQFILSHKTDFEFVPNDTTQLLYNDIQQLIALAELTNIEIDKKKLRWPWHSDSNVLQWAFKNQEKKKK